MKTIFLGLMTTALSHVGLAETLIDEEFVTTFSHYGKLEDVVTCRPGYRGPYATDDILRLNSHSIELGFDIGSTSFRAGSALGKKVDPEAEKTGLRPYAEGCQLAMDQIKRAIMGKNIVEVKVRRVLSQTENSTHRVKRDVNGEVLSVSMIRHKMRYEMFKVELGGFEFALGQMQNDRVIP